VAGQFHFFHQVTGLELSADGNAIGNIRINQQVANRIRRAGQPNGEQYQPGDCLALLDGRVVAVATDIGSALLALRAIDPDPRRGMIVEAGPPIADVIR